MTNTELLLDALEYYTVNPVDRRCTKNGDCYYSPKTIGKEITSQGCLVGRLLNPEVAEMIDKKEGEYGSYSLIRDGKYTLPDFMNSDNTQFIATCQGLHDLDNYWEKNGLSKSGQNKVKEIIELYGLDKEPFSKFLN